LGKNERLRLTEEEIVKELETLLQEEEVTGKAHGPRARPVLLVRK
jgi:hypothetical protein